MTNVIDYWYIIFAFMAGAIVGVCAIKRFSQLPTETQMKKVSEWLIMQCAAAERELGSGTGQLKLRYVYDKFLLAFPDIARILTFESFSIMVDTALLKFKAMLETNKGVQEYVGGGKQ